jgi:antitoxin CptB
MVINIRDLKKKIIYRSNYRGSKELDKLLGSFTKIYINKLDESELLLLSDLLDLDDENLYKFNQGQTTSIKIENNRITELFKKFIYKNE